MKLCREHHQPVLSTGCGACNKEANWDKIVEEATEKFKVKRLADLVEAGINNGTIAPNVAAYAA